MDEGNYYLVTGTEFENKTINWEKCYRVSSERYFEDSYIHLNENDLLITKDGTIGKLAIVKNKPEFATLNSGVFVTRSLTDEYDAVFMFYFLESSIFEEFINYHKTGTTINHLYQETFENFEYCFPQSEKEQKSIASFLDYKTSQIDTLLAKKENLINLLEEKRIALITNAVTKGLNPNVKMKYSGIDWLGDIPEHWKVKRLKWIAKLKYGNSLNAENRINGEIPVYGSNGIVGFHDDSITESPCIIIGRKGSFGKINLSFQKCFPIDTTYYIDSSCTKNNLLWLNYVLNILGLDQNSKDSAVPGLSREEAYSYVIPLPPIEEQQKIVEYIENELEKINSLSKKIEENIGYLKEYRTSLITSVVTGKIDLRNWQPPTNAKAKEELINSAEEELKSHPELVSGSKN